MQLEIAILLFIHAQFALKADSAFFIGMLSPPEDTKSRDVGALDEAGRERYLNSLGMEHISIHLDLYMTI